MVSRSKSDWLDINQLHIWRHWKWKFCLDRSQELRKGSLTKFNDDIPLGQACLWCCSICLFTNWDELGYTFFSHIRGAELLLPLLADTRLLPWRYRNQIKLVCCLWANSGLCINISVSYTDEVIKRWNFILLSCISLRNICSNSQQLVSLLNQPNMFIPTDTQSRNRTASFDLFST